MTKKEVEFNMRLNIQEKWIGQLLECIDHLSHRYFKLKREVRKMNDSRGDKK